MRKSEKEAISGARNGNIKKSSLLFFVAIFFTTHIGMGKKTFFHAAYKYRIEFKSFCCVHGHERHPFFLTPIYFILVTCQCCFRKKKRDTFFSLTGIVTHGNRG